MRWLLSIFIFLWVSVPCFGFTEYEGNLKAERTSSNSVTIRWNARPEAASYSLLRSYVLGWTGTVYLIQPLVVTSNVINVHSTDGLSPGDEIHFNSYRDDFYVSNIIDSTTIEMTYAATRAYASNTAVNLSGCWNKNYSGYSELYAGTDTNFEDTVLTLEKDYYYTVGYSDGTNIYAYSRPLHIRLTTTPDEILYDAAAACNGGYAWKVSQQYSDLPALIDGNTNSTEIRMQYNDPAFARSNTTFYLGYHRFHFGEPISLKRIDIAQRTNSGTAVRIEATKIALGFADQTVTTNYDLSLVDYTLSGYYKVYSIPLNKTSDYVNVYINGVSTTNTYYVEWRNVSVFTDVPITNAVVSAMAETNVSVSIDFGTAVGNLPTIFGTDEIYDNSEGYETGQMLKSWPYTTNVFNLYRIQTGDFWPRAYGYDLIPLGVLEAATTPLAALQFV